MVFCGDWQVRVNNYKFVSSVKKKKRNKTEFVQENWLIVQLMVELKFAPRQAEICTFSLLCYNAKHKIVELTALCNDW